LGEMPPAQQIFPNGPNNGLTFAVVGPGLRRGRVVVQHATIVRCQFLYRGNAPGSLCKKNVLIRGVMDYLTVSGSWGPDLERADVCQSLFQTSRFCSGETLTFTHVVRKADLCYEELKSCVVCEV